MGLIYRIRAMSNKVSYNDLLGPEGSLYELGNGEQNQPLRTFVRHYARMILDAQSASNSNLALQQLSELVSRGVQANKQYNSLFGLEGALTVPDSYEHVAKLEAKY